MFGFPVIETAISLTFIYLLFSLLVSAVNELILGNLAHLRAKVLEESLEAILSNRDKGWSPLARQWDIVKEIARSIKGLGIGSSSTTPVVTGTQSAPAPKSPATTQLADLLFEHPLIKGIAPVGNRCPGYLPSATFVDAVLSIVLAKAPPAPAADPPNTSPSPTLADLRRALAIFPDEFAKQVLGSLWLGVNDLAEARKRLEGWFNDSMGRVSGLYRRYTQVWLLMWSTVVVLLLNVDTVELTKRLVADSTFREAVTAAGTRAATNSAFSGQGAPPTAAQLQGDIVNLQLPIGWRWDTNVFPITRLVVTNPAGVLTNYFTNAPVYLTSWTLARPPLPASGMGWFLKVLGLLISIAAISQGAPFWFDLLNKLTNLRAGAKPAPKTSN
ncbi:MAG TPA: hypothetical protein PLX89_22045 [Verrucomicrobiota bacterium]|nr:hypothetical protein [Verrucomicrobiales bacterium]HRI15688.1 hypothetical protein [Verrucomicrobiota bacterium]